MIEALNGAACACLVLGVVIGGNVKDAEIAGFVQRTTQSIALFIILVILQFGG